MAPTRSRPDVAAVLAEEDFEVNGCKTFVCNDAEHYLTSAHAVLAVYRNSVAYSDSRCNDDVEASALGAVETLIELGLWQMARDRRVA